MKTIHECRVELVANTTLNAERRFCHEGQGWGYYYNKPEDIAADWLPVSAARASFGKEDKTGENEEADRKLLKFLADNRHLSVFEHNYATFLIECPLFVRTQIMRHRSFTFNEMSRRYTSEDIDFWVPDRASASDAGAAKLLWRKQSKNNKQASTDERFSVEDFDPEWEWNYEDECKASYKFYCSLVYQGVCREQARAILPQSLLTRFYMTGNLRSYWSFLSSRLKEDTQYETRVIAQRIKGKLTELWPESMAALFGEIK